MGSPGACRPESHATASSLLLAAGIVLAHPNAIRADELEDLLRRPPTPGSVALLASHARDKGVADRLKLALTSSEPDVRGVAARLIDLRGLADFLPDLQSALTAEADPDAATEEARALVSLGGPAYDEVVLAAARRFTGKLDPELVRILARVRGPQALDLYFTSLHDISLSTSDREAFFRIASRGQRDPLIAAAAIALGHRDAVAWQAILNIAAEAGLTLDQPVMVEALRSEPVFRGEAAWYLAKTYCGGRPTNSSEILATISEAETTGLQAGDPELRFGAEMLRRVLGRPPVEDEAWIACLESNPTCHLDSDFLESPLIDYLTPRERKAILRRNDADLPPKGKSGGKKSSSKQSRDEPRLRLVTGLPKGTARDLIKTGGCTSNSRERRYAVARIEFRVDGLPSHVRLEVASSGPMCREIAASLFLMTLTPPDDYVPLDRTLKYVALFDPDSLQCSEALTPSPVAKDLPDIFRVRGKAVVAPKLVRKVEPFYPESARQDREEGVSLYEAIISQTGCIRDLRLLKSSTALFDLSGMEALSHWRYTPATLNGRPVNVYLTVTVTFRLR